MKKTSSGFTLIELLVVLSIVSLLSSIILSSVNAARERARIAGGFQAEANLVHGIGAAMIGEWKFNDGAGKAFDTTGFGGNGTVSGATYSSNGAPDGSGYYTFTNTNDQITIPYSPTIGSVTDASGLTMSAWVQNTGDYGGGIVNEGTVNTPQWGLSFGNSGNPLTVRSDGCQACGQHSEMQYPWTGSLRTGWHFITAVIGNGLSTLYIDGIMVKQISCVTEGANPCIASNSSNGLQIGNYNGIQGPISIDNVRIYNSTLTADIIKNMYAEEKPQFEVALK